MIMTPPMSGVLCLSFPSYMTHHDVTLQQQCWFNGHTQTPTSSALKVTADNKEYTNKSVR